MKKLELDFVAEVRETDLPDGVVAVIEGRAVPYGISTQIGGVSESFGPAAFDAESVVGKPLAYRHDEPIGVITAAENRADGLYVSANILDTNQGRDAAVLARHKSVQGLSVGFEPRDSVWNRARTAVKHTGAKLFELSLTPYPAYPDAGISTVREDDPTEEDTTMTETVAEATTTEVVDAEAREALGTLQKDVAEVREIAARIHVAPAPHPLAQFRSFGDFSKAVYGGEIEGRALFDQITDDNPGVLPPNWMMDVKNIVDLGRPAISALGVESAGASGMDFAWPYFDGDLSLIVEEQLTQKSEVNSVQISIEKGTASLKTFAAASDISFQLLQRSNPSYLDAHNRIMAASYALVTDNVFVDALLTGSTAYNYDFAGDTDGSDFRAAVFGASVAVETATGAPASVVLVASDVMTKIGGWSTFSPSNYGTVNVSGTADAGSLRVNVSGLPVVHDRNLASGGILVTNRSAAKWIEDGPRLASVDDVAKLGRDVAIYGYGTEAIYNAAGIISLEVVGA